MHEKEEQYQQDGVKYSIWNTDAEEMHLEQNITNRTVSFKKSLKKLEQASKAIDHDKS